MYIKKEFHTSDDKEFTYEDLKRGYFRLLSDNMISEIIPHAVFNPEDDTYDLHLKIKMENEFSVRVEVNVSTTSSNQIYLGLAYQNLNYYSKEFTLDGQLGKNIIMLSSWPKSILPLLSRHPIVLSLPSVLSIILKR